MIDKLNHTIVSSYEKVKPVHRTMKITQEEVQKKHEQEAMNKPPVHPTRFIENLYSYDGKFKYSTSHLIGVA